MEDETNAFYVVRKGDIVGVYKSLSDCQLQTGVSVSDPPVTVYKGHYLSEEAEEYLSSHGLKNAIYSVSANDVASHLFGKVLPCPFQQPAAPVKVSEKVSPPKRLHEEAVGSTSFLGNPIKRHLNADNCVNTQSVHANCYSCTLQFDGASKGNPGQSGAGAVLRAEDGGVVYRVCEGVGIATNNVAEYRALILGLKYALKKGFKHIRVQGDSKLVCMQIQGLWKINNQNLAGLCKEAKELKEKFLSFQISHILRNFNSEADAQANKGIYFNDGEVEEEGSTK